MNVDFAQYRTKMVDSQLRTTDVTDIDILDAMGSVPRELFVDENRRALAYIDEDVRLSGAAAGSARYLMEPSPFAKLLQLAAIRKGDRVLDVGAGTGYSAAILAKLAASVVALESDEHLAAEAKKVLASLGFDTVSVICAPLAAGHAAGAPYDVIVVEGSVDRLPEALHAQLAEGGRLVVVEGRGNAGHARLHIKRDGLVTGRNAFNAAIKSLPEFDLAPSFEF